MMMTDRKALSTAIAAVILILLLSPAIFPQVAAQTEVKTVFTPSDTFFSPSSNGSVQFATNGNCSNITLAEATGVWTFSGLQLSNSPWPANISIKAENCNMTIYYVYSFNITRRNIYVTFFVSGEGRQSITFWDFQRQTSSAEWSVIVPGSSGSMVWLSEGQNWDLLPNNTISVHGVTGNITLARYSVGGATIDRNLPLYLQHSITIITAVVLVGIVVAASVIKFKSRSKNDGLGK